MSAIFLDGYDNYTTQAQSLQKWTWTGTATLVATPRRVSSRYGQGSGSAAVTNSLGRQVVSADENATFIAGSAFYRNDSLATGGFLLGSDSGTTAHVQIFLENNGAISAYRGNPSGTLLGSTSPNIIPANVWKMVVAKVLLSDTVGTVTVQVDGVTILTLTGLDTKNGGTKTKFDCFGITSDHGIIYVDDTFLFNTAGSYNNDLPNSDIVIDTLFPTAAGATTGLTGTGTPVSGAAANWNRNAEVPPDDDLTYVASTVDDTFDTYIMSDLTVGSSASIACAVTNLWARKDTSDPRGVAPVLRSGGTNYTGTDAVISQNYSYYRQIYETNPNTSVQFSYGEINSIEVGPKVRPG